MDNTPNVGLVQLKLFAIYCSCYLFIVDLSYKCDTSMMLWCLFSCSKKVQEKVILQTFCSNIRTCLAAIVLNCSLEKVFRLRSRHKKNVLKRKRMMWKIRIWTPTSFPGVTGMVTFCEGPACASQTQPGTSKHQISILCNLLLTFYTQLNFFIFALVPQQPLFLFLFLHCFSSAYFWITSQFYLNLNTSNIGESWKKKRFCLLPVPQFVS